MTDQRPHTSRQALINSSEPLGPDSSGGEIAPKDIVITDLANSTTWAELATREYEDVIMHRKRWSNALLSLVSLIIIMDFVIMFLAGLGILRYASDLAIPAFIGSSILEIFGLSYIVVQYLFPDGKSTKPDIARPTATTEANNKNEL